MSQVKYICSQMQPTIVVCHFLPQTFTAIGLQLFPHLFAASDYVKTLPCNGKLKVIHVICTCACKCVFTCFNISSHCCFTECNDVKTSTAASPCRLICSGYKIHYSLRLAWNGSKLNTTTNTSSNSSTTVLHSTKVGQLPRDQFLF